MKYLLLTLLLAELLFAEGSLFGISPGNRWYYEYENFDESFSCWIVDTFTAGDSIMAVMSVEEKEYGKVSASYSDTLFEMNAVLYRRRNGRWSVVHDLSIPDNDSVFELVSNEMVTNDTLWRIKMVSDNSFAFLGGFDKQINLTHDIHSVHDEEIYHSFIEGVGLVSYGTADGRLNYKLTGAVIDGVLYGETGVVASRSETVFGKRESLTISNGKILFPYNARYKLTLYSLNGRVIRSLEGVDQSYCLTDLNLSAGMYTVNIIQGMKSFTGRICVTKQQL